MTGLDVSERIGAFLYGNPLVLGVDLVGSRGRGEATALSDWDFQVHTTDAAALARDLPELMAPLEPLAAQWDRFAVRAVYMLILSGPAKIDLFPGDEPHEIEPPWKPTPRNLAAIDAHFWDWVLWLGSKVLAGKAGVVDEELQKLHRNLLGPMGVGSPPATVGDVVAEYRLARDRLEGVWRISVPRRLGDEVGAALLHHGVM
jgi:hypothetical protein